MRLMVAIENRFLRTRNGSIYSTSACDYQFWCRYLQVFDEVVVLARVGDIDRQDLDKPCANGPHVHFVPVPYYIGPWQYLRRYFQIAAAVKKAVKEADAFLLHVPGRAATFLERNLRKRNIPYAVEVVADPWDVGAPGSVKFFLRPLLRRISRRNLVRQCRNAFAATYVTKYGLQRRYPPGGWSTYFSDVILPDKIIIDDTVLEAKIATTKAKLASKIPLRVCYAGTMSQLYKAPDVLIDAVGQCIGDGFQLELVMLGDGQYRNQLENQAAELGITEQVKFLGLLPAGKAVYEQFDKADLFILPSHQEGMPRALVEAMARGLPCLASNVGGIPELLEPEDMVSPGDAKLLAAKIESVLKDTDRLEKMSRRNIKTAVSYRYDILNQRRIEFHKKLFEEMS